MKTPSDIDVLIKMITGKASETEQQQFDQWIRSGDDNNEYYNHVAQWWKQINEVYDDYDFDKAAARKKIIARIGQQNNRTRVLKAFELISWAASLLLLFGLVYILLHTMADSRNVHALYQTSDNEVREIVLPDSTLVWLNEKSELKVLQNVQKAKRKVWLKGEAFFEVKSDPKHPFRVYTQNTVSQVLGTSFHLAINDDGEVNLIVREGKVAFYKKNKLINRQVFLAGDRGTYRVDEQRIIKEINDDPNYLAFITGELIFTNTPIKKVCEVLSHFYEKPVISELGDSLYSITGTFRNESLEDVITILTSTLDIRATITGDSLILHP